MSHQIITKKTNKKAAVKISQKKLRDQKYYHMSTITFPYQRKNPYTDLSIAKSSGVYYGYLKYTFLSITQHQTKTQCT